MKYCKKNKINEKALVRLTENQERLVRLIECYKENKWDCNKLIRENHEYFDKKMTLDMIKYYKTMNWGCDSIIANLTCHFDKKMTLDMIKYYISLPGGRFISSIIYHLSHHFQDDKELIVKLINRNNKLNFSCIDKDDLEMLLKNAIK